MKTALKMTYSLKGLNLQRYDKCMDVGQKWKNVTFYDVKKL